MIHRLKTPPTPDSEAPEGSLRPRVSENPPAIWDSLSERQTTPESVRSEAYEDSQSPQPFCDKEFESEVGLHRILAVHRSIADRLKLEESLIEEQVQQNEMRRLQQRRHEREVRQLHNTIRALNHQIEQYRFAAIALKHVAVHLPGARINEVEWQKGNISEHMTTRSKTVHDTRKRVVSQSKYSKQNGIRYNIEENPLESHSSLSAEEKTAIQTFVVMNDIGNVNPRIKLGRHSIMKLEEVLSFGEIGQCEHLPKLVGQKGTFAKVDIPRGVILGQYVGNEMLKEEFQKIYDGTKEELEHLTFMHGQRLTVNEAEMDIYIDGYAACRTSPLLFVNDGRVDIMQEATAEDRARMNTEYVGCLVNGWPMVLVRTTKEIRKGHPLWIDYGSNYGLVLDAQAFVYDQRKKTIRSVEHILTGIDLDEMRPIELSDDESDDVIDSPQTVDADFKSEACSENPRPAKRRRIECNELEYEAVHHVNDTYHHNRNTSSSG